MRAAIVLAAIVLSVCLVAGADHASQAEPAKTSGMVILLSIRSLNRDLKVGDPVPIEFTIKNDGTGDYAYLDRSYDRAGRMPEYELTCLTRSGQHVDDPRKNYALTTMGGLAQKAVLKPGQSFHKTILLNRWAKLNAAGTYSVTGTYHFETNDGNAQSQPVAIELLPRTKTEMAEHVLSLESKLASSKSQDERDSLMQELMFTLDDSIIPRVIDWMYERPHETFWMTEALSFYFSKSKVKPQVLAACTKRGLAPGMVSTLYNLDRTKDHWIVEPLSGKEWNTVIARSLTADNKVCWTEGCLAAQSHPDDSHTARLIAIAIDPKSQARMQSIYALAMNRTDQSVTTLKQLLHDSDKSIQQTTKSAIETAYMYKGNEVPGRRLLESDFDSSLRKNR